MTGNNLKNRINDLEKRGSTDGDIQNKIYICWCGPGKCDCPPADQVITWDDIDDNVTKPIKGEGEADHGQDD